MGNLLIDRTSMEPHFPEVLARFEVNTSFCLHAGSLGHLVRTIRLSHELVLRLSYSVVSSVAPA